MDALFEKNEIKIAVTGRNLEDLLPLLRLFPCKVVEADPDLVISHGGDGSLLGAELAYPGIPKCPIRDRRENPKCPRHSELTTLTKLFNGELSKCSLEKLEAVTEKGEKLYGINDVVINRTVPSSAIRYRIWLNGELFRAQVVADSLLVATPFGSTGYFQSITRGNLQTGLGLAFNNSMDLMGYTVVEESSKLAVQILRGPAVMVADNDPRQISLNNGDTVNIQTIRDKTVLYGLDVFRCMDCYDLRKRGGL